MSNADVKAFVDEQIRLITQKLASTQSVRLGDSAYGRLGFYLALRRVVEGTSTSEDLGLMDAVNDTLQALKLLDSDETFLAGVTSGSAGGS